VSRVAADPFIVEVIRAYGTGERRIERKNYRNLAGAIAYRDIALRKADTKSIRILMIIDESTPAHSV
jgi:hypothetical protein